MLIHSCTLSVDENECVFLAFVADPVVVFCSSCRSESEREEENAPRYSKKTPFMSKRVSASSILALQGNKLYAMRRNHEAAIEGGDGFEELHRDGRPGSPP